MKIEEGCLAVMINSFVPENIGRCVTVLKFVGEVDKYEGLDRWLVDGEVFDDCGEKINHQQEAFLMRIDGIKEPKTERKTTTA